MATATMSQCKALAKQAAQIQARSQRAPSANAFFRPGVRFVRPRVANPRSAPNAGRCNSCGPAGFGYGAFTPFGPWMNDERVREAMKEFFGSNSNISGDWQKGFSGDWQKGSDATNTLPLAVDVLEEETAYHIVADVPGLSRSDIKVQVSAEDRTISISGERKRAQAPSNSDSDSDNASSSGRRMRRTERRQGKFQRKLNLPEDCDFGAISASVADGVLSVRIVRKPKTPPPAKDSNVTDIPIDV